MKPCKVICKNGEGKKERLFRREQAYGITQQLVLDRFEYREGFLYWKKRTTAVIRKNGLAGYNNNGVWMITIGYQTYLASRLIFLYHHGYLPDFVDHEDRNTLNNLISNLRPATNNQNNANRCKKKSDKNTSKYLGVFYDKHNRKWVASISVKRKNIKSNHESEQLAVLTYNQLAVKYHKEFANLNIITP